MVEATPVKKAAIRSRPSQSQPGPPETRAGAPTLPVAASMSANLGNLICEARGQAAASRRVEAGRWDVVFCSLARSRRLRDAQTGTGDWRLCPHGGAAQSSS